MSTQGSAVENVGQSAAKPAKAGRLKARRSKSRRPRRISPADREWLPYTTVRLFGPLQVPTVEQLRVALTRFLTQRPRHPMACTIDATAMRWRPVPPDQLAAHVERMIDILPPGDDVEAAADANLRAGCEDLPIRLLLNEQYFGFAMAHVLGDASSATLVVDAALRCADDPDAFLAVPPPRTGRHLVRLLTGYLVRRPARLKEFFGPRAQGLSPGPALPGPALQPACAVVATRTETTTLPALRAWRDAHAPGQSIAMLMCWAARRALASAGAAVRDDGLIMLVDLRRYGKKAAGAAGNLAKGIAIAAPESEGPAAVAGGFSAMVNSPRPLTGALVTALTEIRRRRPSGPAAPPVAHPVPARATVLVTYLGKAAKMGGVQWLAAPEHRRLVVGTSPGGVGDVTLVMTEIEDVLQISITFHESRYPRPLMRHALEILADPVTLFGGVPAEL